MKVKYKIALATLVCVSCGQDEVRALSLAEEVECGPPTHYRFEVRERIPRSHRGLTEGLIVHDGSLYESTGRIAGHGPPVFNRIDPQTGQVTFLRMTPDRDFGEGLVRFGGRFYQLTYKERRLHVYETDGTAEGTRRVATHRNPMRQGWGLTTDGEMLLATDGSEYLYRISPETFKVQSKLRVRDENGKSVRKLNELEYVEGEIYAHIFPTSRLIRFDAKTGCRTAEIDLSELRAEFGCPSDALECNRHSVANGIALEPGTGQFFITGKSWPVLFKGEFVPLPSPAPSPEPESRPTPDPGQLQEKEF